MILAWSVSEIVRYAYYLETLLFSKPNHILVWLRCVSCAFYSKYNMYRYSLFYVLYPLGAAGEAFMLMASIPTIHDLYGSFWAYFCLALLLFYPAGITILVTFVRSCLGLVNMYLHMHNQRRRKFSSSKHDKPVTNSSDFNLLDKETQERKQTDFSHETTVSESMSWMN